MIKCNQKVCMKKVLFVSIIFTLVLCFTGCGSTTENKGSEQSTMEQPIVENEYEVKVSNLHFFIPKELKVNSYNGYNMTYNYYIDSYNIDDCDLLVNMVPLTSYDSVDTFMNKYVKVENGNYSSEQINNAKWYLGSSSSKITNYMTVYGDYYYNVSLLVNTNGTTCSRVNDMIKQTLFISEKSE